MKIKSILLAIALAVAVAPAALADGFLGIDGEESTSIGIYVKDLATGEVLVDHNSQLALTPASVMKAVTSATALSINGADARFNTKVCMRGTKEGSILRGDIVVHGSADPTLESENFKANRGFGDSIAAALRRRGIKQITGTIVVRQTMKDPGPLLQWEVEDLAWPYGAGLFGFNYRDNTATVYPNTGKTSPEVPGLEVCVTKITEGSNNLVRGIDSNRLMVYTRNTADKKWALNTTVPDPAAMFTCELTKKLSAAGITVGKKAAAPGGQETTIYTHRSPRSAEILKSLMVRSDNLFAEGMLRSIEPAATRKAAIKRERELWASRGINTRYTIINDGSGLTRANRLSAHFLGDVLEWMAKSPLAATYASFFPKVGKEGTVRGFLAKTPLTGKIALKTGSVSSVQCYAGYKFDDGGKPSHVIVIMVNGFFCPRRQVREGAENLLLDLFAPAE